MKKKSILNLIKYYSEENDAGFRSEAYEIAKDFDESGDYQLAEYIMALMSNANTFVPQMNESDSALFEKIESSGDRSFSDTVRIAEACQDPYLYRVLLSCAAFLNCPGAFLRLTGGF